MKSKKEDKTACSRSISSTTQPKLYSRHIYSLNQCLPRVTQTRNIHDRTNNRLTATFVRNTLHYKLFVTVLNIVEEFKIDINLAHSVKDYAEVGDVYRLLRDVSFRHYGKYLRNAYVISTGK